MIPNITVQLYSVREDAEKDYAGTIRRIAEMGFDHVEPAGFPGSSPAEAGALFKELGIKAPSQHGALPYGEEKNRIIEEAQMVGTQYIFTGCPPDYPNSFSSEDEIKKCAEIFTEASNFAKEFGIQVGIHNHTYEMMDINGKPAYDIFLENTPEEVLWEADIYWVCEGGRSIPDFIKHIGERAKVLHFKDGSITNKEAIKLIKGDHGLIAEVKEFLPAGKGNIDLLEASKAVNTDYTELIAVELDSYNGVMMDAVAESYEYLTKNNIAKGRI